MFFRSAPVNLNNLGFLIWVYYDLIAILIAVSFALLVYGVFAWLIRR